MQFVLFIIPTAIYGTTEHLSMWIPFNLLYINPHTNNPNHMKNTLTFFLLFIAFALSAQVSNEAQIASAVMAAPEEMRENASVMGYNASGTLVLLKEGSGDLICQADDPSRSGFSVSCYHKDLEPFMRRGRELRAEGLGRQEVFAKRGEEIKAGTLSIPEGSTLHILYGPDEVFDPVSGSIEGAKYRYVVYVPFATSEQTGLPLKPSAPGAPWLMDPGSHRAHIMITPVN